MAKPKIAEYPFTTLKPNLGVVKVEDYKSFIVADIPGLIENAHKGAGLGFRFLRHVERTLLLLHLVDISDMSFGDPIENLKKVNRELSLYSKKLEKKPMFIAATKIDIANTEKLKKLKNFCKSKDIPFFSISAVTGKGIKELTYCLYEKIKQLKSFH